MFCINALEALDAPARETLFRVAQPHLDHARLTATELAFDPREQRRLLNAGMRFQEFVQRVAILQGQMMKNPVTERVRQIIDIVDEAMRLVEQTAREIPAPMEIDAATIDRLAASDPTYGPIRAGVAIAATLATAGAGDWVGKANRCLTLFDSLTQPAAIDIIDQTLAELVRIKASAATLIGSPENLALVVRACLMIAGDDEAGTAANTPPFILALVARQKRRATPRTVQAAVEVLKGVLASPASIAKRDPTQEIKQTRSMRDRITKLPRLLADQELQDILARRMSRLVAPELLEPLVAREIGAGRKAILLLGLHCEIGDPGARKHLVTHLDLLVDSREFKDEFFVPGSSHDEKRALVAQVAQAITNADLIDIKRQRYQAIVTTTFAYLGESGDRRISPRMIAGPEDRIQIGGVRVPLRNWSETGLMFGPYNGLIAPGQRMRATVMLRNAYIAMGFEAELEIVRQVDGLVGAKYNCADPQARQRIKAHFRA
ncbi:MAG: hypothetical protein JNN22_11555 [Rhodospirillales bacterium]|nr:hypothetical protein [Rhodospirillales bacterium]